MKFIEYSKAIEILLAEELMLGIQVSSFPWLKQSKRREMFNKIKSVMSSRIEAEKKPLKSYHEIISSLKRNFSRG